MNRVKWADRSTIGRVGTVLMLLSVALLLFLLWDDTLGESRYQWLGFVPVLTLGSSSFLLFRELKQQRESQ